MQKLKKDVGVMGLLYASLGGIIGSGWLFGSLFAAKQAGPLSVYSWLVGAAVIILVAFIYAELSTLFPKSGALVHISHVGHGMLVGRIWSWILFLTYVSIPPIEVIAALAYANNYFPFLLDAKTHALTGWGFLVAILGLALIILLNFFSIRWVMSINSGITFWKLIIPILTVIILMSFAFHPSNLHVHSDSDSISWINIFTAMVSSGVIFSYFGFRTAIEMAGETKTPGRHLPIAIIGSVLIAMVVYIGLQLAFILSLPPEALKSGWAHLSFTGSAGPLAALVLLAGAAWWAPILYLDAFVSPLGTGYIYGAASARIIMAAGETDSAPRVTTLLNRQGVPWVGLLVTFVVGIVFLFPFPSWQKMVSAVSSINVLSYSIGPIVLLQLRNYLPEMRRPFRIVCAWLLAPLAFFVCNALIFWSGYQAVSFLFIILSAFFVIYIFWAYFIKKIRTEEFGWAFAWWIFPYFFGLWLLTRLGPTILGGNGTISFGYSMLLLFIFSMVILAFALRSGLPKEELIERAQYIASLQSYAESIDKK